MVLPEEAVLERNATTNNIAYVVMDGCRRTITVPVEPMVRLGGNYIVHPPCYSVKLDPVSRSRWKLGRGKEKLGEDLADVVSIRELMID